MPITGCLEGQMSTEAWSRLGAGAGFPESRVLHLPLTAMIEQPTSSWDYDQSVNMGQGGMITYTGLTVIFFHAFNFTLDNYH